MYGDRDAVHAPCLRAASVSSRDNSLLNSHPHETNNNHRTHIIKYVTNVNEIIFSKHYIGRYRFRHLKRINIHGNKYLQLNNIRHVLSSIDT